MSSVIIWIGYKAGWHRQDTFFYISTHPNFPSRSRLPPPPLSAHTTLIMFKISLQDQCCVQRSPGLQLLTPLQHCTAASLYTLRGV